MKDKNMTPAKLAEELLGDGIVRRMKSFNAKVQKKESEIKKKETKGKDIEKKVAAKQQINL